MKASKMFMVRGPGHFKGGNTIKSLLVAPEHRDNITQKSRMMYRYNCNQLDCEEECIGESPRAFGVRLKEHFMAPSPSMTRATPLIIISVWTTSPY